VTDRAPRVDFEAAAVEAQENEAWVERAVAQDATRDVVATTT